MFKYHCSRGLCQEIVKKAFRAYHTFSGVEGLGEGEFSVFLPHLQSLFSKEKTSAYGLRIKRDAWGHNEATYTIIINNCNTYYQS